MATTTEPPFTAKAAAGGRPVTRSNTLLYLAFAAVYIVWGSTYLAIRIGIESFPPFLLAGSRHLLAGAILYPLVRWKTGVRPSLAEWRTAAITGTLLLCVGNGGVSWAEQTVPSGVTALLVATVSLWLVLVDWLRPGGVRPVVRVGCGLLLGFAGLALLVGPAHLGRSQRIDPLGAGVLVLASFAWSCGSVYSRHGKSPASPLLGVAMQSLVGGTVLWVVGLLTGEVRSLDLAAVSLRSWLALFYLVAFGSFIGFTAYVYLLKRSTPARVGTYAFVNPVVALFLGWLVAGETLSLRTGLAAVVILAAVVLVITAPRPPEKISPVPQPAPGEA